MGFCVNIYAMIVNLKKEKLYLVKCSDWQVAVSSTDHYEACTSAVTHMINEKGKNLKLSCVIVSVDVSSFAEDLREDEATMFHPASKILANAGLHDISKNLKQVFGT